MKGKIIISLLIISIATLIIQATEPEPEYRHPRYRPESWRGPIWEPTYPEEFQPDTDFYAMTNVGFSEPTLGYPMYSGIVKGFLILQLCMLNW